MDEQLLFILFILLIVVVCCVIVCVCWRKGRSQEGRRRVLHSAHKAQGNPYVIGVFESKNYADAIQNYNRALRPDDLHLIFKHASTYYRMGCYATALPHILALVTGNPRHRQGHYLMVRALWGLRWYRDALAYTKKSVPKDMLEKPFFQSIQAKCEVMINQSEGRFDIDDIQGLEKSKDVIGEYTGPIEIIDIPGKGRRVIAKSDIKMGQLIMCEKAFGFVTEEDAIIHYATKYQIQRDAFPIFGTNNYLVWEICSKLSFEPSLREQFFDLYAGPFVGIPHYAKTKGTEMNIEDAEITNLIVKFNAFKVMYKKESKSNTLGVWPLGSIFNSGCVDATAHFVIHNEYMFVRAAQDISRGQEIITSYLRADIPNRRYSIDAWRFKSTCSCRLCCFEHSEHPDVQQEINEVLYSIQVELLSDPVKLDTQISRIWKIIKLRESTPKMNMALLNPAIGVLCNQLTKNSQHIPTAIKFYEKIHEVLEDSSYDGRSAVVAIRLIDLFICLADKKNGVKWVTTLKTDLVKSYGSILAIKLFKKNYDTQLRSALDIDFFAEG